MAGKAGAIYVTEAMDLYLKFAGDESEMEDREELEAVLDSLDYMAMMLHAYGRQYVSAHVPEIGKFEPIRIALKHEIEHGMTHETLGPIARVCVRLGVL